MSIVSVYNEWDPIEEIIVGTSLYAKIPSNEPGYYSFEYSSKGDLNHCVMPGKFPQKLIEETEEDIANFITLLEKMHIKVRRPNAIDFHNKIKTLDWESEHFFCYCPRDVLLAIGDTIIETPNLYRSRYFETMSYKEILIDYLQSGSKWISAPKPRLLNESYNFINPQKGLLNNIEPIFDAANILRAGKDIFYLVSDTGNELGATWLQAALGNKYKVHPCRDLYGGEHIDSTLSLLRPGLVLVNPARVNKNNLPSLLNKWDVIVAPEMVTYSYSDIKPLSTKWLGMNLLMLSPNLAVVDKHQIQLIKLLESYSIDVIPLQLRHGRQLAGGFHCITLDVKRSGSLEDYFC